MIGTQVLTQRIIQNLNEGLIKNWLETVLPEFLSFFWCVILALITYYVGKKVINAFRKAFNKAMDRQGVEPGLRQFLDSIFKAALYIVLLVVILGLFGITTATISAAVAALGVTAGLSLQGALSNFAGGCLILMLHPFRVGDYIIEDTHKNEGTVEEISVFYTTLKTLDGRKVVIPNGTLANSSLTNCSCQDKRMINLLVGISYDSDVKKAKEILKYIAEIEPNRIEDEEVKVFVAELGDSAVQMGLRFWVRPDEFWATKWKTLELIKERFDAAGVVICFNQLDVHIDQNMAK